MRVFRSFQGKLLFFFLLIDVVAIGILAAAVSHDARESLEAVSREHLLELARLSAHDLDGQLRVRWSTLESLAANPLITRGTVDPQARNEGFADFFRRLTLPGEGSTRAGLWLLGVDGAVLARNDWSQEPGDAFARAAWWPKLREGVPQTWLRTEGGQPWMLFALPVVEAGRPVGVLVARFDLSFVHGGSVREGLGMVLLDGELPLSGGFLPRASHALWSQRVPGQPATALLGDMLYLLVPVEGFAREHGLDWSLVLSVPAASISAPVEALRRRMLEGGAVTAVLLALLVIWRIRLLLRPLQRLQGAMRWIIEGGDLHQRIQLQSPDELGTIANTFNLMLERLAHRTAELERSRDHLSLLAQITSTSPNAVFMVGTDGHTRVWNGAAEAHFGWPRLDMLGSTLVERLVPEAQQETFQALLARASTRGAADAELALLNHEGRALPVHLTVSRIVDAAGGVQGHVGIVRDLREFNRLRESLVRSEKMAAMGTLVAGLSHELNNPLGIILGFAQGVLKRSTLDDASRTALLAIETHAQRCARLVRALLDFSRKGGPLRGRIQLDEVLAHVRERASGRARHGEVQLDVSEPPARLLPPLEANQPELESALMNVVGNALDATPPGGKVSVGARVAPGGDGIELFVEDTGRGIPPDVLPRIFDPFFTTRPVGEGTGLGLSITRSIVEAHGGHIDVESVPGAGTTVRMWFPVQVASEGVSP